MVKRFALRETLNSIEACDFISHLIREEFSETDLLAYCREGRISPYIMVKAKPIRSTEPVVYALNCATHEFSASGLHQVTSPGLIGTKEPKLFSFYGEARAIASSEDEPNVDSTQEPFICMVDWSEERSLGMSELLFPLRDLRDLAEGLSSAQELDLDKRAERGVGQTIAAVAALAAKGEIDLLGEAPFNKAQKLHEKGEIEFTIKRDTFKKYFSLGGDHIIVGPSRSPKFKPHG